MSEEFNELVVNDEENQECDCEGVSNTLNPNDFSIVDPILLNNDDLYDCKINQEEFEKGIQSVSKDIGVFTALVSSGMSINDAISYIFTIKNIDMNIKLAEINAKATVEGLKAQKIEMEKNSL